MRDCVILKTNVTVNRNVACCELGCIDLTKISHSATAKETDSKWEKKRNKEFLFFILI